MTPLTTDTTTSIPNPWRRLPNRGVDFQNRGVDFYTVASTSIPWRRLPNRGVDFHTVASTSKNELREASDTCCVYMPVQWVTQCSHRAAGQKMCHHLAPQAAQQLEAERAERDRRGAECGALREVWRACAAVASASVSGARAEEGRSARGLVRGSTSFASTACFVLLYSFVFAFLRRSSTRVLIVLGSSSNRRRSRSPRAPRSAARAFGWGRVSRLGWVGRWARTHDDDARRAGRARARQRASRVASAAGRGLDTHDRAARRGPPQGRRARRAPGQQGRGARAQRRRARAQGPRARLASARGNDARVGPLSCWRVARPERNNRKNPFEWPSRAAVEVEFGSLSLPPSLCPPSALSPTSRGRAHAEGPLGGRARESRGAPSPKHQRHRRRRRRRPTPATESERHRAGVRPTDRPNRCWRMRCQVDRPTAKL